MSIKWWMEDLQKQRSKTYSHDRKRSRKWTVAVLAVMIGISASGCALLPEEKQEEVIPVITPPKLSEKPVYAAAAQTIESKVSGVGKLMSAREETLFFTEEGKRIRDIYIAPGDFVQAGDVLMSLDVQELQDQLREKRLGFREAELRMKQTLRNQDQMTDEEFEREKIQFEKQRLELTELQEQIGRSTLTAPFSGTIVTISAAKGDQVKAYSPVAVLADLTQLAVTAKLSSNDLQKVAPGMEAIVEINGAGQHKGKVKQMPVNETSEGNRDSFNGFDPYNPNGGGTKIEKIEDFLVVELSEMPEGLNRGTPLSVAIVIQRKENAIVIPPSTLRTYGGRTYVQVVDEDGSKREVDVEVGQQSSTVVEIVKGLEPGQKVVGK
ncbi:efflux RND transporter periplasmic adaptor subunit [Marinicrinis sediminis]|uniref:Efflux RND transporter periplasmic adaptor subunit n=1 Tax=Marinicrinis sediminis TaxID=1652465 RepID=A0ABW5RB89_9BACL